MPARRSRFGSKAPRGLPSRSNRACGSSNRAEGGHQPALTAHALTARHRTAGDGARRWLRDDRSSAARIGWRPCSGPEGSADAGRDRVARPPRPCWRAARRPRHPSRRPPSRRRGSPLRGRQILLPTGIRPRRQSATRPPPSSPARSIGPASRSTRPTTSTSASPSPPERSRAASRSPRGTRSGAGIDRLEPQHRHGAPRRPRPRHGHRRRHQGQADDRRPDHRRAARRRAPRRRDGHRRRPVRRPPPLDAHGLELAVHARQRHRRHAPLDPLDQPQAPVRPAQPRRPVRDARSARGSPCGSAPTCRSASRTPATASRPRPTA